MLLGTIQGVAWAGGRRDKRSGEWSGQRKVPEIPKLRKKKKKKYPAGGIQILEVSHLDWRKNERGARLAGAGERERMIGAKECAVKRGERRGRETLRVSKKSKHYFDSDSEQFF